MKLESRSTCTDAAAEFAAKVPIGRASHRRVSAAIGAVVLAAPSWRPLRAQQGG